MNGPGLTVIMPLKNYHDGFLRKALESVLAQTSPLWRLLIVVEPADLGAFKTLLRDETQDSRIEIIVNQGYRLAGAVNSGMKRATTDFVALLLADDMWSTDAVETLTGYIGRYPEIDFFHSSRRYLDEEGRFISSVYRSKEKVHLDDFKFGPVKHLLCWRRSKALSIGGLDESLSSLVGPDDYDFPWMMAENGAAFKAVKECLYYYRNHCECFRLTTHTPLSVKHREVGKILKKHKVGLLRRVLILTRKYLQARLGSPSLYRSRLDKWIIEKTGYDVRRRWKPVRYR
ncbi:MAG: glycosyltransferase, partial [Candidatus Binatia bacterium]